MADVNNYVLGRGRVNFELFAAGQTVPTGNYLYLGNTPTFQLARTVTSLDHYTSEDGVKTKDLSVDVDNELTIDFSTDNISLANLGNWFGGAAANTTQTASTSPITETHVVKLGGTVKLGVTTANPVGVFNIDPATATVLKASVAVAATDYYIDGDSGTVHFYPTSSDIMDGDSVTIGYKLMAGTNSSIVSAGTTLFGSIFFLAKNTQGNKMHYTFPYVKLSPTSNFDLKSDTWGTLSFQAEALQAPGLFKAYLNGDKY